MYLNYILLPNQTSFRSSAALSKSKPDEGKNIIKYNTKSLSKKNQQITEAKIKIHTQTHKIHIE